MHPFLKDAIQFHPCLNRKIWGPELMRPEVRDDLLLIMEDFKDFLGIEDLYIVDVTVSGSMAAYTYTPHSDIDLHLVVRVPTNQTAMYAELFDAKKNLYNLTRHIKVRGYAVELYVQNVHDKVQSMGLYSVLTDRWIDYPKRIRANIDDLSVLSKVDIYTVKMMQAIDGDDLDIAQNVWDGYRAMRKSGLAAGGEFSPENLAFKIIRTRGLSKKLYDRILELKDKLLTLEHIQEQALTELFNMNQKMNIEQQTSTDFQVSTIIDGNTVDFLAVFHRIYGEEHWEIMFSQSGDDVTPGFEYEMNGNGHEFAIMGFIKQCFDNFIKLYDPNYIKFSSESETSTNSRTNVYLNMLKRYLPNNYEFKSTSKSNKRKTDFAIQKKVSESVVVTELFDRPLIKQVDVQNDCHFMVSSTTAEYDIIFSAESLNADDGEEDGTWDVVFKQTSDDVGINQEFDMTGNGNEFAVMGFVKECMVELIRIYAPNVINFSATREGATDSRAKVYTSMLKRYLPSAYSVNIEKHGRETFFVIRKKLSDVSSSPITELFDSKHDMKIIRETDTGIEIETVINNRTIRFGGEQTDYIDGHSVWEIAFYEEMPNDRQSFGMTGSGRGIDVMSFIKQCIDMVVVKFQPGVIRFTADKDGKSNSRAQLYQAMVKRYLPSGYHARTSDTESRTNFWIERN